MFLVENKFFHDSVAGDSIAEINKSGSRLGYFGVGNVIVLSLTNNFFILRGKETKSKRRVVFFDFDIRILVDKIIRKISGKIAASAFERIIIV